MVLGISDAKALQVAMAEMAAPQGYLIEEMITNAVIELLVGIVADPAHGPVLTIAEGGIYTELCKDKVTISLPAHKADISAGLARLRCWPKALGYRGQKGCDKDAIVALISAVCDYYFAQKGAVSEIEMNPVIATSERIVAVDALMAREER